MRSWLELLWRLERNIFRIATSEEYRHLVRNLPNERTLDPASDGALVRWIVDEVADARPGVDIAAVQNLQSTLALVLLNRGLLRTGALERTVDALIDDILDELFGSSGLAASPWIRNGFSGGAAARQRSGCRLRGA